MRPRRGAAVARLFDAIFTQSELFHCQITKHPPQRQRCETHESCRELRRPSHVLTLPVDLARSEYQHKVYLIPNYNIPMTLIHQTPVDDNFSPMDILGKPQPKEDSGKSLRPVRNRRYTRRSLVAGQRPQKRLFTPEIKRYLKDWLVRRRDNPYPNREEKKYLAHETGLTYIQICNWFANWRRKLKNVNVDRNQQTWGHLIRTYNDRAQGNVEQFSICSDDSIWSGSDHTAPRDSLDVDPGYADSPEAQMEYQREDSDASSASKEKYEGFNNNTYSVDNQTEPREENKNATSPLLLSKWLESAARFQPSETNYSWWGDGKRRKPEKLEIKVQRATLNTARHDRDEVEAAVALTALAGATNRLAAL